jgi:hypothetical protein
MKARSSNINHPEGFSIETPILIPSFSSKGFSMDTKGMSEIEGVMKLSKEFLTDTILISAYDLYYHHIPEPSEFVSTKLVFIDSGGYEVSRLYELSGINKVPHTSNDWNEDYLKEVIDKWPERFPAAIVNYDHEKERRPLEFQISRARSFFDNYQNKLSDFLIKPENRDNLEIPHTKIIEHINDFNGYDILGFTEKELGNSIYKRMINIYHLRTALDKAGIENPMHIFGSLDPLASILYFLAGAEIFDGLTWLKYSFFNGLSVYIYDYGALDAKIGIQETDSEVRAASLINNGYYLDKIKYAMQEFLIKHDFHVFESLGFRGFSDTIKNSYIEFQNKLNKS